jgi:hypothetical protein
MITKTIKVYINDRFYKDVQVNTNQVNGASMYDPKIIIDQIMADKEAGLLTLHVKPGGKMVIRMDQV